MSWIEPRRKTDTNKGTTKWTTFQRNGLRAHAVNQHALKLSKTICDALHDEVFSQKDNKIVKVETFRVTPKGDEGRGYPSQYSGSLNNVRLKIKCEFT